MPSGHLTLLVERFTPAKDHIPEIQTNFLVEIKFPEGCLKTKKSPNGTFNDELCFDLAPSLDDITPDHLHRHATVQVFQLSPDHQQQQLIGMGILELENLELDEHHHSYNISVVDKIGKHSGDVSLVATFHASRTPAKLRDELGVEFINEVILDKGPFDGCRERNKMRLRSSDCR
jgi:hypothetical protein